MLRRRREMAVKFEILIMAGCFGLLAAKPAAARQNPTPPPSGIVIHLFGQDSLMSNVLPDMASPAAPMPTGNVAAPGATAPGAAQSSNDVEPTLGDVLHQMFVTGDPNDPPKPSTGRFGGALSN
jgi:hypothetical protein